MLRGWALERSWLEVGSTVPQLGKIVHDGDGPAENVLRFRDRERRVPVLK
jgi:hypothetical protein